MKLPVGSEIPARPYHGEREVCCDQTRTPSAPDGWNPGAPGRAEGLKEEEEQEQGLVITHPLGRWVRKQCSWSGKGMQKTGVGGRDLAEKRVVNRVSTAGSLRAEHFSDQGLRGQWKRVSLWLNLLSSCVTLGGSPHHPRPCPFFCRMGFLLLSRRIMWEGEERTHVRC